MPLSKSLKPAVAPAAVVGADVGVELAAAGGGALEELAGALLTEVVGAGVGLGGSGSLEMTGPRVFSSWRAATDGRSIGLGTSSKLDASSSDSSSSLSANLDAILDIDSWLSFIDGGGPREAMGAATGSGLGGSIVVFVGDGDLIGAEAGADAEAEATGDL